LLWRAEIAQVEEGAVNLAITPFEKNLEVWKQLWRVIERSDLLLQIVDARNPYFFYSEDLEKYIAEHEGSKEFLLLINKADFLTEDLIGHWNTYFTEKKVNHIFFSALDEQTKIDVEEEMEKEISDTDSDEEDF
jgi:large subunit GTPase 1